MSTEATVDTAGGDVTESNPVDKMKVKEFGGKEEKVKESSDDEKKVEDKEVEVVEEASIAASSVATSGGASTEIKPTEVIKPTEEKGGKSDKEEDEVNWWSCGDGAKNKDIDAEGVEESSVTGSDAIEVARSTVEPKMAKPPTKEKEPAQESDKAKAKDKKKDKEKEDKAKKKAKKRAIKKKKSDMSLEECSSMASGSSYYHDYDSDSNSSQSSRSSSGSELSLSLLSRDKKVRRGLTKEASKSSLLDNASIRNGSYRGRSLLLSDDEGGNSSDDPDFDFEDDEMAEFTMDLSFLKTSSTITAPIVVAVSPSPTQEESIPLPKPRARRDRSTDSAANDSASVGAPVDEKSTRKPIKRVRSTPSALKDKIKSLTKEKEKKEKDKKERRKKDRMDVCLSKPNSTDGAAVVAGETAVGDSNATPKKGKSSTFEKDSSPGTTSDKKKSKAVESSEVSEKDDKKKSKQPRDMPPTISPAVGVGENDTSGNKKKSKKVKDTGDTTAQAIPDDGKPLELASSATKKAKKPKDVDRDANESEAAALIADRADKASLGGKVKSKSNEDSARDATEVELEAATLIADRSDKSSLGGKVKNKSNEDSARDANEIDLEAAALIADRSGKIPIGGKLKSKSKKDAANVVTEVVKKKIKKEKSDDKPKKTTKKVKQGKEIRSPTPDIDNHSTEENASLGYDLEEPLSIYFDQEDEDPPAARTSSLSTGSHDGQPLLHLSVDDDQLIDDDVGDIMGSSKKKPKDKKDRKKHRKNSLDIVETIDQVNLVDAEPDTDHAEGQDYYRWSPKRSSKSSADAGERDESIYDWSSKKQTKSPKKPTKMKMDTTSNDPRLLLDTPVLVGLDDKVVEAVSSSGASNNKTEAAPSSESPKRKKKSRVSKQELLEQAYSPNMNFELVDDNEIIGGDFVHLTLEQVIVKMEGIAAVEETRSREHNDSLRTVSPAAPNDDSNRKDSRSTERNDAENDDAVIAYISTTLELLLLDSTQYKDESMMTFVKDFPQSTSLIFDLEVFPLEAVNKRAKTYLLSVLCALGASCDTIKFVYSLYPKAIRAQDNVVGSALHYAVSFGLLATSRKEKLNESMFQVLEFLTKKEPSLLTVQPNVHLQSVLHQTILALCCNDSKERKFAKSDQIANITDVADLTVSMLLEMQPLLASLPDSDGMLPLHLAAKYGVPVAIVEQFLKENSDSSCLTQCTIKGFTPLHYAAEIFGSELKKIVSRIDEEQTMETLFAPLGSFSAAIIVLTKACPYAAQIADQDGNLPLHVLLLACTANGAGNDILFYGPDSFVESLRSIVEAWPDAAEIPDSRGVTPFTLATRVETCDTVRRMFEAGQSN